MSEITIPPQERLDQLEKHYADRVTDFRQRLAELGLDKVLVVLLDIGKNAHWVTAASGAGVEWVRPHRLPSSQVGLSQFIQMTDSLIAEHQPALTLLGHEPTGVYHEPWARALMDYYKAPLADQTMSYTFFNPYQVKLARQQTHLRHRKSDPLDLAAMFDLSLRGLGQAAFLPTGVELLVRQEVGFIRAQSRLLRRLQRQLWQQLDRLWPGAAVNVAQFKRAHPGLPAPTPIVQTRPFERDTLRVLLLHYPNPYHLKALSDDELLALFRQHMGRCGPATLKTLRTWAKNAVLLPKNIAEPLAEQLQRLFNQYLTVQNLVEEAHGRLIPLIPHTPAHHIVAIPGLGDYDAARYYAGLGSIGRFHRSAEVWAFMGFDPICDGSGDKPERIGHLSKHGDPNFRDALYLMSYRVAQNYAPVGLTFANAFLRGKCEVEATLHAAHRVNRICFHLIKNDEPFQDQSTPKLEAEYTRRWQLFKAEKKKRKSRRKRGNRR